MFACRLYHVPSPTGGRRRTIRLCNHDYSSGAAYFVTLCTYNRERLFGEVENGFVRLSQIGNVVQDLWTETPRVRPGVVLDAFVIMPDHFHGIVGLPQHPSRTNTDGVRRAGRSLGTLIGGYKAACTSTVSCMLGVSDCRLWQRNYYERIIRDERALDRMRRYIVENPARWWYRSFEVKGARGAP